VQARVRHGAHADREIEALGDDVERAIGRRVVDAHLGIALAIGRDPPGDHLVRFLRAGEPKRSRRLRAAGSRALDRRLRLAQQRAAIGQESLARLRDGELAGGALEEVRAPPALEQALRLGQEIGAPLF